MNRLLTAVLIVLPLSALALLFTAMAAATRALEAGLVQP